MNTIYEYLKFQNAETVSLLDGSFFPIPITVDHNKLRAEMYETLDKLGLNDTKKKSMEYHSRYSINLSKEKAADDLYAIKDKVECACHVDIPSWRIFENILDVLKGSYYEQVLNEVAQYHYETFGSDLCGRNTLIWSLPGYSDYPMHKDRHTLHRYHIPLETHNNFYFIFEKNNKLYKVHPPADGRVWYLDSKNTSHTIRNFSVDKTRLHIILTDGR